MAHDRPWYKRWPTNFLAATVGWPIERIGVYAIILDMIYDKGGPIRETDQDLARRCSLSTRKFREIKTWLVANGKLTDVDGELMNPKAARVLAGTVPDSGTGEIPEKNRQKNGKKTLEKQGEKQGVFEPGLLQNKDLTPFQTPVRACASPEERGKRLDTGGLNVDEEGLKNLAHICSALGIDLAGNTYAENWRVQLVQFEAQGLTFELFCRAIDLLKGQGKLPDRNAFFLNYLAKVAVRLRDADRTAAEAADQQRIAEAQRLEAEFEPADDMGWAKRLTRFLRDGFWYRSKWGPSPLELGCRVPLHLLQRARIIWHQQGDHPEEELFEKGCAWRGDQESSPVVKPTPFAATQH